MITVRSPPPVADVPAPFRVTSAGADQETCALQGQVPEEMETVSPADAWSIAFCTSSELQDKAVIVDASALTAAPSASARAIIPGTSRMGALSFAAAFYGLQFEAGDRTS